MYSSSLRKQENYYLIPDQSIPKLNKIHTTTNLSDDPYLFNSPRSIQLFNFKSALFYWPLAFTVFVFSKSRSRLAQKVGAFKIPTSPLNHNTCSSTGTFVSFQSFQLFNFSNSNAEFVNSDFRFLLAPYKI
jgi:hypothetical protein